VEVCSKFGGDLSGSSCVKEGLGTNSLFYIYRLANRGARRCLEKFDELTSPIWTFFVKQSFFSSDLFRFWSLGYLGIRGANWQGRTCIKNLH